MARVVLTGVTSGIGQALFREFVKQGHEIFGCARRADRLEQLRQELTLDHIHLQSVDVTDAPEVSRWAEEILHAAGPPDLVINNAALINKRLPFWEIAEPDFDQVIDVNIKGVANVMRRFLPSMIARQQGIMVNFSSGWGHSTSPGVSAYCASKFAIEGLTQAVAQDVGNAVTVVALQPGIVHTPMLETAMGASANQAVSPQEWAAQAVPFFLQLNQEHHGQSPRFAL